MKTITITDPVADPRDVGRVISSALEESLGSILMARAEADRILGAIREAGYVVVPREPTGAMLDAAWADALAEDAAGVWAAMVEAAG